MRDYQRDFIEFAIQQQVLQFGAFTLKSGRISPYFFNMGLFNSGLALAKLGRFYASAIAEANLDFDVLFGPAYKGVPIVSATAVALAEHHDRNLPWCFNRKEAKKHGEGGLLVGAPLKGRVLIIDDVITAGTAIREVIEIIVREGAEPAAVVIALDRLERGTGELSAIQEVERNYDISVISIVNLQQIMTCLSDSKDPAQRAALKNINVYRNQYGV